MSAARAAGVAAATARTRNFARSPSSATSPGSRPMTRRKVLLLSVSAGAGHVRAADALTACAENELPDVEALHLDVMDYASKTFRKLYADAYLKLINKHPALWG